MEVSLWLTNVPQGVPWMNVSIPGDSELPFR